MSVGVLLLIDMIVLTAVLIPPSVFTLSGALVLAATRAGAGGGLFVVTGALHVAWLSSMYLVVVLVVPSRC